MKLTTIENGSMYIPSDIKSIISNTSLYDSSSSPEARVYLAKDICFIKRANVGTLQREAEMYSYFHKKGLSPEVIHYCNDGGYDWLVTSIAKGEDCTAKKYLDNPKKLCDTLAQSLRMLHELPFSDCPVQDRNAEYISTADKGYKNGLFDKHLFSGSFKIDSAEEAYETFSYFKGEFKPEVLLHGDYCLPNVILDSFKLSSFIDVGCGGVGDRHIDIFWGVWTLFFNLKTEKYTDRFLDAYGRDVIRTDMLRAIASAEVFA